MSGRAEEDVAGDLAIDFGDQRDGGFAALGQERHQPGLGVGGEGGAVDDNDGGQIGECGWSDVDSRHKGKLSENASTPRMGD